MRKGPIKKDVAVLVKMTRDQKRTIKQKAREAGERTAAYMRIKALEG